MSTKYDRRLQKLESEKMDLLQIAVCPFVLHNSRAGGIACPEGQECECREMQAAHMAKTRGAGTFIVIDRGSAGL